MREEEAKKREEERVSAEFLESLQREEQKALEAERQQRLKQEEEDYKVLQILNLYPGLEHQGVRLMLEDAGWSVDRVLQQLGQQIGKQRQEQEAQEQLTLQLMQLSPSLSFEQARATL